MKIIKTAIYAITLLMLLVPATWAGTSEAWGVAIATGDKAKAFSVGHGDEISLGSLAFIEDEGNVHATANGRATGDIATSANAGSSGSIGEDFNTASAFATVHGIGDASGFTWAAAWE